MDKWSNCNEISTFISTFINYTVDAQMVELMMGFLSSSDQAVEVHPTKTVGNH